ncbi:MAG: STAS domain-containing protein [Rhodospirillaceae bacterium]
MTVKSNEHNSGAFRVGDRLTINDVEQRRNEWLSALPTAKTVTIDAAGTEAVDVAGLQLLIALRYSSERAGKAVRLAEPAEGALLQALTQAGFCETQNGALPVARDGFWRGEV